jgi:hypothetical protein
LRPVAGGRRLSSPGSILAVRAFGTFVAVPRRTAPDPLGTAPDPRGTALVPRRTALVPRRPRRAIAGGGRRALWGAALSEIQGEAEHQRVDVARLHRQAARQSHGQGHRPRGPQGAHELGDPRAHVRLDLGQQVEIGESLRFAEEHAHALGQRGAPAQFVAMRRPDRVRLVARAESLQSGVEGRRRNSDRVGGTGPQPGRSAERVEQFVALAALEAAREAVQVEETR